MRNPDYPRVKVSVLQEEVVRYHRIELWLAGIILVGTGLVVLHWFDRFAATIPTLGFLFFLGTTFLAFTQLEVPEGDLIEDVPPERLGRYTSEELHQIVQELCLSFDEREVPNIYVVDSAEANAFVLNVDILNMIRPWNAVYISSYILHAFEKDELQAVLAHEMCHFSLHPTFWSRFFYIKPFLIGVWVTFLLSYPMEWLWLKTSSFVNFWLAVFLLGLFGVTRWLWGGATFVAGLVMLLSIRSDSQEIESLCDYEAAKRFGLLAMVNALLKLGSRQEIFGALLSMLSPDETDPFQLPKHTTFRGGATTRSRMQKKHPAYLRARERLQEEQEEVELDEEEIQAAMLAERNEVIAKAYEHLSKNLPRGFISLEESWGLIREALEASEGEVFEHESRSLLRWLEHDHLIPNHRIDEEEYVSFIHSLREHPELPLFFIPEEISPELASLSEHPTLKDRILFLEFNREEGELSLGK